MSEFESVKKEIRSLKIEIQKMDGMRRRIDILEKDLERGTSSRVAALQADVDAAESELLELVRSRAVQVENVRRLKSGMATCLADLISYEETRGVDMVPSLEDYYGSR